MSVSREIQILGTHKVYCVPPTVPLRDLPIRRRADKHAVIEHKNEMRRSKFDLFFSKICSFSECGIIQSHDPVKK